MTDIVRKRGDTYADEFILKNKGTGLPIDINGCTFLMTLDPEKAPTTSENNVYQIVGSVVDAAAGRVEFAPTAEQADRVGNYFFDVQMVDTAGRKRTVDSGKYKYEQDITKQ